MVSIQYIYDRLSKRHKLKKYLRFENGKRIYVVSGNIENIRTREYKNMVILAAPDAEGAAKIKTVLEWIYPKSDVIHTFSSAFSPEFYPDTLLSVGGPKNNKVTQTLLAELTKGKISFDGLDIVTPMNRFSLETDSSNSSILTDYGLVIIGPNPFNYVNQAIIIAGCDTTGVLAAARCLELGPLHRAIFDQLSKSEQFPSAKKETKYFVVKTRAIGTSSGEPQLVEFGKLDNPKTKKKIE